MTYGEAVGVLSPQNWREERDAGTAAAGEAGIGLVCHQLGALLAQAWPS